MRKQFIRSTTMAIFGLSLCSHAAFGQWYGSANISRSSGSDGDQSDATGYALNLGYEFTDYIALQAGYVDFGEFEARGDLNASVPDRLDLQLHSASVSADGIEASLLFGLPVSETFKVYAELGYYQWETNLEFSATGSDSDILEPDSSKGEDLLYGLGLEYRFHPKVSMTLEGTYYETEDEKLKHLSAGIKYRF